MDIELPEKLNGMEVLATLFSPAEPNIGILVTGENYEEKTTQPLVCVYLIAFNEGKWFIQEELQAFSFWSFKSAKRFVDDLPNMSAIDLMLLMNGLSTNTLNGTFVQ